MTEITNDQLIAALLDMRPAPRPEFAAQLDGRVAEGFPTGGFRGDLARLLDRLPTGRGALMPALSGVALAVVAVGLAVSQPRLGSGPDNERPVPTDLSGKAGGGVAETAAPSASAPRPPVADMAAPARGAAASPPAYREARLRELSRSRAVERSAQLALATQPGNVEDVADGVIRVVGRHDGIVSSSSVTGGDVGSAGAEFKLLVPGDQLQATINDLSGLAHVRSRTEGSFDITRPVIDARRQLRQARRTHDPYAIRSARQRFRSLQGRVHYARVDVSIVGDESAGGSWGLGDAVDDAGRVLTVIAGSALVGLAVLVPAGLLVAIAWFGYAATRRRSRERALDQPS